MNAILRFSAAVAVLSALGCSAHVVGGGGGLGGAGGSTATCPAPTPGTCFPTQCVNGTERTGEANCVDGAWVCVEVPCTGGCLNVPVCANGQITSYCCPPDGTCDAAPYCDLGNGACADGPCPDYDAGPPPCMGSVDAANYEKACATDADCVGVYSGPICGDCFCPNSAISKGALPAYSADFSAGNPPVNVCDCSVVPQAFCAGGVCELPFGG